jgi:hypothetical protein
MACPTRPIQSRPKLRYYGWGDTLGARAQRFFHARRGIMRDTRGILVYPSLSPYERGRTSGTQGTGGRGGSLFCPTNSECPTNPPRPVDNFLGKKISGQIRLIPYISITFFLPDKRVVENVKLARRMLWLCQTCYNNLVTSLLMQSRLLQVVNSLFQNCWQQHGNKQCEHNL